MNEEKIDRLVDALEAIRIELSEIGRSLASIDRDLSGCISHNGNNNFLCVTGNVSTY